MTPNGCAECKELFDRARAAISQHIDAIGRFQSASINQGEEALPELEEAMRQARTARENAIAAFKIHTRSHTATGDPG